MTLHEALKETARNYRALWARSERLQMIVLPLATLAIVYSVAYLGGTVLRLCGFGDKP